MPPAIEFIDGGEYLINGIPRRDAKDCQIIQIDHNACATCPLAEKEPEEPPSKLLEHLVYLAGLQEAGAWFTANDLSPLEWQGLKLLKQKRNERQLRDLKEKK